MTPLEHLAALAKKHEARDPGHAEGLRVLIGVFTKLELEAMSWPEMVSYLASALLSAEEQAVVAERRMLGMGLLLNLRSAELSLRRPRSRP